MTNPTNSWCCTAGGGAEDRAWHHPAFQRPARSASSNCSKKTNLRT